MNDDRYKKIRIESDYTVFKFVSEGRYGNLTKIVSFDEIEERENVFNLALGTVLSDGTIDFVKTTNNGDRNKILVTVVGIVGIFIEKYPEKRVYITGSDHRRTVLYQRAIAYGHYELTKMFNVYGDISRDSPMSEFEVFDKTKTYVGFLVEKKIVNGG